MEVKIDHYKWNCLTRGRFLLYQKCIEILSDCEFFSVLEVGPGPGVLANILHFLDKKVMTLDFDFSLKPNIVADVRKMPLKNKSFDMI